MFRFKNVNILQMNSLLFRDTMIVIKLYVNGSWTQIEFAEGEYHNEKKKRKPRENATLLYYS